jgi:hypothetical protein
LLNLLAAKHLAPVSCRLTRWSCAFDLPIQSSPHLETLLSTSSSFIQMAEVTSRGTCTNLPHSLAQNDSTARSEGDKKLRAACDVCRNAKVKCSSGGSACHRCIKKYVGSTGLRCASSRLN